MIAADALSLLLGAGVVVLVVSTVVMAAGYTTTRPGRRRTRRGRRGHPLTPSAAQTLEVARARAALHQADQRRQIPAATAATSPSTSAARPLPTGQIIDISDGRRQGRTMSVEYAQAIAEHVAENDPHRVAEVINQWIRADSTDPLDLFR